MRFKQEKDSPLVYLQKNYANTYHIPLFMLSHFKTASLYCSLHLCYKKRTFLLRHLHDISDNIFRIHLTYTCILQCIDKLSVQLGLCAVQITESYCLSQVW